MYIVMGKDAFLKNIRRLYLNTDVYNMTNIYTYYISFFFFYFFF